MTIPAVVFFLLGFAASWVAGRYVARGAASFRVGP
jgi:hypothetical protein